MFTVNPQTVAQPPNKIPSNNSLECRIASTNNSPPQKAYGLLFLLY